MPGAGQGPLIIDAAGEPVWIHPGDGTEFNVGLRPQTYQGAPVLVWWHGRIPYSHGYGSITVLDDAYRPVAEVRAGNGEQADLHDATITDADTMLLLAYSAQRTDLRAIGGPADGWVYEGVVQEVDIATGAVLMEWRSLRDIPVTDSYFPLDTHGAQNDPYDYLHINSARIAPDGDIIVSCRHTGTVCKIARDGAAMRWRLGGKRSDFDVAADAGFQWQHCARQHADGTLSLFDNNMWRPPAAGSPAAPSSALILDLDEAGRTAGLRARLFHPDPLFADTQGSVQPLPDGSVFVGWGSAAFASLYDPDGNLVWDAAIDAPRHSYRSYTAEWTGRPQDDPAIAAVRSGGATGVYASWIGATEVTSWRIFAGPGKDALEPVAEVPRSGFETSYDADPAHTWFAVAGLDSGGTELGRSPAVRAEAG